MLIDDLIRFCDQKYKGYGRECSCDPCNHPSEKCSGSCYDCLYQIHYPGRFTGGKKSQYDCQKLIYHYVCEYSYIYASEILYALNAHQDYLKEFKKYHLISIGCGACPDLIALEKFCNKNDLNKQIQYRGYDPNPLWAPIHNRIHKYCDENRIKYRIREKDAITYFSEYYVPEANILIVSYLISYLYNTNQIKEIDRLFGYLVKNVVMRKQLGLPFLIIINDVNSNRRGRDYFRNISRELKKNGLRIEDEFRYFDNNNLNYYQRIGTPYDSKYCLFKTDDNIKRDYHILDSSCRSIQYIIEVQ